MHPDELRAELKQGDRHPVYLLAGPDGFRAERTAQWLREESRDEAMGDLNCDLLWADETPPAVIAQKASAYAMFGGRRLVWVRHAEALPAGDAIAPLLAYLESPSPDTLLVFTSSKLDKRLKFTTACAHSGRVVEFAALRGAALREQVQRQAQALGVRLGHEAVEVLLDMVGDDLAELDSELQKLALGATSDGTWGPDEVRVAVAASRDIDAFELVDAMDPRQPRTGLRRWFEMRQRGSDVYGSAAILLWRFRQLTQLRQALDEGLEARDAARFLGMSPWQTKRLTPLMSAYSGPQLQSILGHCLRAEARAKSTSLGAGWAYDLALLGWATETGA
jgi:DNA polymerase-3 subunit delta